MSTISYRFAAPTDAEAVSVNELGFCGGRGIPPEGPEGVIEFLRIGGRIAIQEDLSAVRSAFWYVNVESISCVRPSLLPVGSPLRSLAQGRILERYFRPHDTFVFSWTHDESTGALFLRKLRRSVGAALPVGHAFVGFASTKAWLGYERMGARAIGALRCLYGNDDEHVVLALTPRLAGRRTSVGSDWAGRGAVAVSPSHTPVISLL